MKNLPLDIFPDPNTTDEEGLVAYGGELSPEVLLSAYLTGIFPWFSNDNLILWWSPDPRLILYPNKLRISKSLKQLIKQNKFEIRIDSAFEKVIRQCADTKRKGQDSTWITRNMQKAYIKLHKMGYAHSVETYLDGTLVGGLYGLTLGKIFSGESMFFHVKDASKVAFCYLVQHLYKLDYAFIDAQTPTSHLKSFGAQEMQRKKFLQLLKKYISLEIIW